MIKTNDISNGRIDWQSAFYENETSRLSRIDLVDSYSLLYYPPVNNNPYQKLLYLNAIESGFFTLPLTNLEHLDTLECGEKMVLHLHWLGSLLRDAIDIDDAKIRVGAFRNRLISLKKKGVKILWTAHNILPHNAKYIQQEIRIRKLLAKYCDVIHLMNRKTVSVASEFYALDRKKTFVSQHPSYEGWYANLITKNGSRHELGISPRSFVFLCFGAIANYKSLSTTIAVFQKFANTKSGDFKLIVAGSGQDEELIKSINQMCIQDERIEFHPNRINDSDIQTYFKSADFVIVGNEDLLNSGVISLACSFRRAVIARRLDKIDPQLLRIGISISNNFATELPAALEDALNFEYNDDSFNEILETIHPNKVSTYFFANLRKHLSGTKA